MIRPRTGESLASLRAAGTALAFACFIFSAANCGAVEQRRAQNSDEATRLQLNQERLYAGLGTGIFDLDDNLVHLDSSTASLWLGYRLHRFVAAELTVDYIERDTDTAERGFTSEFAGLMVAPSILLKYPINEGWEPFARLGYSQLDYELLTESSGGTIDESAGLFTFGVGLDIGRFRVEYLNYGKVEDAQIEQLRIGLNWDF